MRKKNLKSAVIGLGVGLHQARTLAEHPHCDLISICDFNKKKLYEIGSEFKDVNLTHNDQDILSDPNIDLVCVASHDEYHYSQVIECLDNNKHVYVEKPICLKEDELKDIKKKVSSCSNLSISSNMVLRTCPLFNEVKDQFHSDKTNDIYHIEADYLWGRKEKIITGWRAEADFYSIIHGAAVHMIDLVLWMTGKKPFCVNALASDMMVSGTKQKHSDFVILLLEYENKMSIKISAHGGGIHPHFHALKVFGKNSSFIHDYAGTFWIESDNPDKDFRFENALYPAKTYRHKALESFIDSIINPKKKALVSKDDVFDVMSVCIAAEKAVNSRQRIKIEYV